METGNARDVHCQEIFGLIIEFMTPKRIQPYVEKKYPPFIPNSFRNTWFKNLV